MNLGRYIRLKSAAIRAADSVFLDISDSVEANGSVKLTFDDLTIGAFKRLEASSAGWTDAETELVKQFIFDRIMYVTGIGDKNIGVYIQE